MGHNPPIYSNDPWGLLQSALSRAPNSSRPNAAAYLAQAHDYFHSAFVARNIESKPLLFYYGFHNLLKFAGTVLRHKALSGQVQHGMSLPGDQFSLPITAVRVEVRRSSDKVQAVDEMLALFKAPRLTGTLRLGIDDLLGELVVGHRLYSQLKQRRDRFIALNQIALLHDPSSREAWIRLSLETDKISRIGTNPLAILRKSGLEDAGWRRARDNGNHFETFIEMANPITYTQRPIDVADRLAASIKPFLSRLICPSPEHRRYYLFLGDRSPIGHDMAKVLILFFYLCSLVRYRPQAFQSILEGPHGACVREHLAVQPMQFLYEMMCLVLHQEVHRGQVVE